MFAERFQLLKPAHKDRLFGTIEVVRSCRAKDRLAYKKTVGLRSPEQFAKMLLYASIRERIVIDSLLRLYGTSAAPGQSALSLFFEMPDPQLVEDLAPGMPAEVLHKLVGDGLSALALLETNGLVHGSLRPDFLKFDRRKKRWFLIDRLDWEETEGPGRPQLTLPPEACDPEWTGPPNIPKIECWLFGMIVLWAAFPEVTFEAVYEQSPRQFNQLAFVRSIAKIEALNGLSRRLHPEVLQFLKTAVLVLDARSRSPPILAYSEFRRLDSGLEKPFGSGAVGRPPLALDKPAPVDFPAKQSPIESLLFSQLSWDSIQVPQESVRHINNLFAEMLQEQSTRDLLIEEPSREELALQKDSGRSVTSPTFETTISLSHALPPPTAPPKPFSKPEIASVSWVNASVSSATLEPPPELPKAPKWDRNELPTTGCFGSFRDFSGAL